MFKGIKFLMQYTWKCEKRYIIYSILKQVVQGISMLIAVILPKYIIDSLMYEKDIWLCLKLIFALAVCNFGGNFLVSYLSGQCFNLNSKVFTKFQAHMAEILARCDFERLEDPKFLDDKERAKKFIYAHGRGFGRVMDMAFDIVGKVFVFAGIASILASLNIWLVVFFVVLIVISAKYEAKTRKRYFEWDMQKAPIERRTFYLINLIEDFHFGKDIRLFGLSDWIVNKVKIHLNESDEFYKKQIGETNKSIYFSTVVNAILEGTAYVVFALQAIAQRITIGSFSMYVSAMLKFSGAMQDVMKSIVEIKQFSGYYDALERYMNVPAVKRAGKNILPQTDFREITFENVSFKYPGQNSYSLQNVNISIKAGEKVAIVGENGAGKSTFVKLLCRLYDPTEGAIKIDGIDIKDFAYDSYMKMIGPVFQDYKLFSFCIKDNICFEQKEPDSKIEKLLEESGLKDKINSLDAGIHTFVYKNFDESGFEPSGGESQKIAIARAVYKDAPIVILDEPTSALDPRAEYELYQRFHDMVDGKTAIFISHRMSSCKFCDNVLFFKNGGIQEQGAHEALMDQKGQYYELFNLQAQYYTSNKSAD